MRLIRKKSTGQTLFELLIALAVTVLVVTGIIKIVTLSVSNATFAKNQAEATRYSQGAIEWVRAERDKGWDNFATRSNRTWCLRNLAWDRPVPCSKSDTIDNTIFVRQAELNLLSAGSIEVIVRVSWDDAGGTREARTGTILTQWRESGAI